VIDAAGMPCPTDDTLGALVHQSLDADEAARIASHLDACVACQQIAIAALRSEFAPPRADHLVPETQVGWPRLRPTAPHPAMGARFGRYELRALIGTGGMGAVYEALDTQLDRAVALKVLRPELSEDPGFADRLMHESRLMARVAHPAVITVYDVGRQNAAVFVAMELIRGATLHRWLASHALDWRQIVSLFELAGHGLAAAHAAGIVHRDFKPDNVLVGSDGRKVVVTDFGIARDIVQPRPAEHAPAGGIAPAACPGRAVRMTTDGAVIGTPAYMAPEQFLGELVDLRADVFAFSVSLWEALFGTRPFPGRSATEIYAAMHQAIARPAPGTRRIPRRLLRALRRGLAIEARDRWRDMPAMLAELAAVRGVRKRNAGAAAAAALVGVGIAASLAASRPDAQIDRCARGLAQLDEAYNPRLAAQVDAALAGDPEIQRTVANRLATMAAAWRRTQLATCRADREVAQDARTAVCLDARRLELAGAVDDVIDHGARGARYAVRISALPREPAACAAPASGLLFAHVPVDRELRRRVTALRDRLADALAADERSEYPAALAEAQRIATAAEAVWPPLYAEAEFLLGTIQSDGGDHNLALTELRDAAVLAERVHHDDVAAASWIKLALAMANDERDPAHALEYATYADAAADRLGRPPDVMARVSYARGMALVDASRTQEAEAALRTAIALAEAHSPRDLAAALQGLGLLFEDEGRAEEAVAMYRKAMDHLPRSPAGEVVVEPVVFQRLSVNLSNIGDHRGAELEARRAVAISDRTLPVTHVDRVDAHLNLADVLQDAGRYDEALAELIPAVVTVGKLQGIRSESYGQAVAQHGWLLSEMGRHAEAEPLLARGCDIIAFAVGEDSTVYAACDAQHGIALAGLHRNAQGLAKLNRSLATLTAVYGDGGPQVAMITDRRGVVHAALGHHDAAAADFAHAVEIFAPLHIDPGYLATARWHLGKELWARQPARARAEIAAALALFATAGDSWAQHRGEATAWLARHEPPARAR